MDEPPAHSQSRPDRHQCLEWCPICRGAELLRTGVPPEVVEQLHAMERDGLELMRTLIDLYLQRLDDAERGGGHRDDPGVEQIHLDD